jgi:hypothetical protein
MKTLILNETYINNNSLISNNVPFEELRPLIFAIQDFKLREVVGTKLLNQLMLETSTDPDTLTAANKILCDDYVLPFLNWQLMADRCITGGAVLYAAGTMVNRTDNSDPVPNKESEAKKYANYAASYETNMIKYLQANLTLFPLYLQNTASDEVQPVKTSSDAGGLFLNENYSTPRY